MPSRPQRLIDAAYVFAALRRQYLDAKMEACLGDWEYGYTCRHPEGPASDREDWCRNCQEAHRLMGVMGNAWRRYTRAHRKEFPDA